MTQRKEPPQEGTRGRRIYDARIALGLTQNEAARLIGTNRRSFIRWENNRVRPGLDYSEAISETLGLPLEAVLDPDLAHIRRSPDMRVSRLLAETASLRSELLECRRENRQLRRQIERLAS